MSRPSQTNQGRCPPTRRASLPDPPRRRRGTFVYLEDQAVPHQPRWLEDVCGTEAEEGGGGGAGASAVLRSADANVGNYPETL